MPTGKVKKRTRTSGGSSSKGFLSKKVGYKAPTKQQLKARAEQSGMSFDAMFADHVSKFKADEGSHRIRFLQRTWDDVADYGLTVRDDGYFGLDIFVHYDVGPENQRYLCPNKMQNKSCPVCEEYARLSAEGKTEAAKSHRPGKRVLAWVIDRDNEDEGPQLWDMPYGVDKDLATLAEDNRTGEFLHIDHPDEGFDVEFRREGTTKTKTRYVGLKLSYPPTPLSDDYEAAEKWLDHIIEHPLPSVLKLYSYEHMDKVFSGFTSQNDQEEEEEEEDTEEPPFDVDEDEDSEYEEEEEEDVEEEEEELAVEVEDDEEEEEHDPRAKAKRKLAEMKRRKK